MLFGQGKYCESCKVGPSEHIHRGNVHCLQLKGKPHPFTMVVLTQIIKAHWVGGVLLSGLGGSHLSLSGRMLLHSFPSVCIRLAPHPTRWCQRVQHTLCRLWGELPSTPRFHICTCSSYLQQ